MFTQPIAIVRLRRWETTCSVSHTENSCYLIERGWERQAASSCFVATPAVCRRRSDVACKELIWRRNVVQKQMFAQGKRWLNKVRRGTVVSSLPPIYFSGAGLIQEPYILLSWVYKISKWLVATGTYKWSLLKRQEWDFSFCQRCCWGWHLSAFARSLIYVVSYYNQLELTGGKVTGSKAMNFRLAWMLASLN